MPPTSLVIRYYMIDSCVPEALSVMCGGVGRFFFFFPVLYSLLPLLTVSKWWWVDLQTAALSSPRTGCREGEFSSTEPPF